MSYVVHVKQVAPQTVVSQRRHTSSPELDDVMRASLARVAACVESTEALRGEPFAIYHETPHQPGKLDVEIGLPVDGDAKVAESTDVRRHLLRGGPAAYTIHEGSYDTIAAAYDELRAWIERHGHEQAGPPRENYIVGPGQGLDLSEYRTEVQIPIC